MAAVTTLHPGSQPTEEPLSSPEVLVLNALLSSGRFDPHAYAIDVEMCAGYHQAWNWCLDYQDSTKAAPPVALFHRTFPDIEIIDGVNVRWAAEKLRAAHYDRTVRRKMAEASLHLKTGDMESLREVLREVSLPSPLVKPQGLSSTDPASVSQSAIKIGWPTPWASLNAASNGIGRGEVALVAARFGVGKSQLLAGFAVEAAKHGARVAVASCEMPSRQYLRRVHRWQAKGQPKLLQGLIDPSEVVRIKTVRALPELKGSIEVFDPSQMRMNMRGIEVLAAECDVLLIDHVGLLSDSSGKPAGEDWRIMAMISNSLKEMSLRFDIALLAAAQINRAGEHAGDSPPKASDIAQSDALGQDADLVITLKKWGEEALACLLAKNRDGKTKQWYTKFYPGTGDFDEISKNEAELLKAISANNTAND